MYLLEIRTVFLFAITTLTMASKELQDCLSNEILLCYHCDSQHDAHCGNPFEFSHYYLSEARYLTVCYGCCGKIVEPIKNGARRILRSCTENLPKVNLTSSSVTDDERHMEMHLCEEDFCNGSNRMFPRVLLSTVIPLLLTKHFNS